MTHQPEGTACNCDEDGWMPGIEHVPNPNFGYPDDWFSPIAVMQHIAQGYQQTLVDDSHPGRVGLSQHFSTGRTGRKVQHVSIREPAYHAGIVNAPTTLGMTMGINPNRHAVGIEAEGFSANPVAYAYDYLYDTAHLWPEAMVAAIVDIGRWVFADMRIAATPSTYFGHCETDTVDRANDPGSAWPQQRIIAGINGQQTQVGQGGDVAIFNKADDNVQAAADLSAVAAKVAQEVVGGNGDGVFIYQSGPLVDEAGNTITIPAGKVGTLLIHDA